MKWHQIAPNTKVCFVSSENTKTFDTIAVKKGLEISLFLLDGGRGWTLTNEAAERIKAGLPRDYECDGWQKDGTEFLRYSTHINGHPDGTIIVFLFEDGNMEWGWFDDRIGFHGSVSNQVRQEVSPYLPPLPMLTTDPTEETSPTTYGIRLVRRVENALVGTRGRLVKMIDPLTVLVVLDFITYPDGVRYNIEVSVPSDAIEVIYEGRK